MDTATISLLASILGVTVAAFASVVALFIHSDRSRQKSDAALRADVKEEFAKSGAVLLDLAKAVGRIEGRLEGRSGPEAATAEPGAGAAAKPQAAAEPEAPGGEPGAAATPEAPLKPEATAEPKAAAAEPKAPAA